MKISIAQLNLNTNDFGGNLDKIVNSVKIAEENNIDIVLTPELSLCGYLVQDLIYEENFVQKNLEYLQKLANITTNMKVSVLVGHIGKNYNGIGKKYYNCVSLISNGTIQGTYHKRLLPFYDVFSENRWFESGKEPFIFNLCGKRCGVVCCEDIWAEKDEDNTYNINPVNDYKNKVDFLFSLNFSPWYRRKDFTRQLVVEKVTSALRDITLVYCNAVGGYDDLICDGGSLVVRSESGFSETLTTLNNKEQNFIFDSKQLRSAFKPRKNDDEILRSNLLLGLGDYIRKSGFNSVIIGSSAGVDSATVLSLACDAVGSSNVYGLIMPSINNENRDAELAKVLHTNLGCNTLEIPIDYEPLLNKLNESKIDKPYSDIADQNLQARLRDIYIMHFANAYNLLPLATGNKTESAIGYYTLNDMNLGFDPISDLYKRDVYNIAKLDTRIPKEIIERKPTAALKKGQTDEQDLLPYPILDEIIYEFIENNISLYNSFIDKTKLDISENDYNRIIRLVYKNEFKRRQNCLGLKTTKKAFGSGRRFPVCQVI